MIAQLTKIYLKEARFKKKFTEAQAKVYYQYLRQKNCIICAYQRDMVIAYVEFYLVNAEQAERLVAEKPFHIAEENITDGNICYIMDVYVDPDFRGRGVIKLLKKALFERTKHCICYVGREQKRNGRIRIRRR